MALQPVQNARSPGLLGRQNARLTRYGRLSRHHGPSVLESSPHRVLDKSGLSKAGHPEALSTLKTGCVLAFTVFHPPCPRAHLPTTPVHPGRCTIVEGETRACPCEVGIVRSTGAPREVSLGPRGCTDPGAEVGVRMEGRHS